MNAKDNPHAFKTSEEAAADQAGFWASMNRLMAIRAREDTEEAAAAAGLDVVVDEETSAPESDNDESGDYVPGAEKSKTASNPKGKAKASVVKESAKKASIAFYLRDDRGPLLGLTPPHSQKLTMAQPAEDKSWMADIYESDDEGNLTVSEGDEVTAEDVGLETVGDDDGEDADVAGDVLDVNGPGWKRGNPKTQPLTYYVYDGPSGQLKAKTIKHEVDFDEPASVNRANKTRRLEVNRSKKRHGITGPLKRPPTKGREYTKENQEAIRDIHKDWAKHNKGQRIPANELTALYNNLFPGENRTKSSLTSHIDHIPELKKMRYGYSAD